MLGVVARSVMDDDASIGRNVRQRVDSFDDNDDTNASDLLRLLKGSDENVAQFVDEHSVPHYLSNNKDVVTNQVLLEATQLFIEEWSSYGPPRTFPTCDGCGSISGHP